MKVKIVLKDKILNPIKEKSVDSSQTINDSLSDFPEGQASIYFPDTFNNIKEINLKRFKDKKDEKSSSYYVEFVTNIENIKDSFSREEFYAYFDEGKVETIVDFGSQARVNAKKTDGLFIWTDSDSPGFLVTKHIDLDFTYFDLFDRAQLLDDYLINILHQIDPSLNKNMGYLNIDRRPDPEGCKYGFALTLLDSIDDNGDEIDEWYYMWDKLAEHPINKNCPDPRHCENLGQTWRYLDTALYTDGKVRHCFMHRRHPEFPDKSQYIWIMASVTHIINEDDSGDIYTTYKSVGYSERIADTISFQAYETESSVLFFDGFNYLDKEIVLHKVQDSEDKNLYLHHLVFDFNIKTILVEENEGSVKLFYDQVDRDMKFLEELLGDKLEYCNDIESDWDIPFKKDKALFIFMRWDDEPYLNITLKKPIGLDFSYNNLLKLAKTLDNYFVEIINQIDPTKNLKNEEKEFDLYETINRLMPVAEDTEEWVYMWQELAKDSINKNCKDPTMCENDGVTWQYYDTALYADSKIRHCFFHAKHPGLQGKMQYKWIDSSIKLLYRDQNLDPMDEKLVAYSDRIIEPVFQSSDTSGSIYFFNNFNYITKEICLMNVQDSKDENLYTHHLEFNTDIKTINLEDYPEEFELFCDLVDEDIEKLEKLIGNKLDLEAKGVASVKKNHGHFIWMNDDRPFLNITKPIDKDFTYDDLLKLTKSLDNFFVQIINRIDSSLNPKLDIGERYGMPDTKKLEYDVQLEDGERETKEWLYMWEELAKHPINENCPEPTVCENDGETWQYMDTAMYTDGLIRHCFRHRMHPNYEHGSFYVRITASSDFESEMDIED